MTYRVLNIISLFAFVGLLSACAEVEEKEQLLSASGFTMKYADTPEELNHLKLQVQHEIISYSKKGETYFVYADTSICQCMYVGDSIAYQQFLHLQAQQNIQDWETYGAQWGQSWGNGPWNGYGSILIDHE
jgi:hypothetical protein